LTKYLDLAGYLLIAEAVLGVPGQEIARWPGIGLAESALHAHAAGFSGIELYPEVIDKAAAHTLMRSSSRS
jgi:death-on-curing protein